MNYSQLKAERGGKTKYEQWISRREHEPEVPDDRWGIRLTSADWWLLLTSQASCSFCLSWDRVSCTDFKEASTVEQGTESLISVWNLGSRLCRSSDLAGRRRRCPAGFSCSRRTVWWWEETAGSRRSQGWRGPRRPGESYSSDWRRATT